MIAVSATGTNATLHDCKEAKTSNLLSSQELWSLFQTTNAEAMDHPTGGSAFMPKKCRKRHKQGFPCRGKIRAFPKSVKQNTSYTQGRHKARIGER